jgi:hypothetical protein
MILMSLRRCLREGAWLSLILAVGCGSSDSKNADLRRSAYVTLEEGLAAFSARDYANAEQKLTAAIDARVLNPDSYCQAVTKRAVCSAVASKFDDALADLEKLGPAPSNADEVFVVRSFIYKKQGKAAESRAALAKARQYNRTVQEFKD